MPSHNDDCNGEMAVMHQKKNVKSGTAESCPLIASLRLPHYDIET